MAGTAGWLVNVNNTCSAPCTFTLPFAFDYAPSVLLDVREADSSGATFARTWDIALDRLQVEMDARAEGIYYLAVENRG